jgi:hypothetical protein
MLKIPGYKLLYVLNEKPGVRELFDGISFSFMVSKTREKSWIDNLTLPELVEYEIGGSIGYKRYY